MSDDGAYMYVHVSLFPLFSSFLLLSPSFPLSLSPPPPPPPLSLPLSPPLSPLSLSLRSVTHQELVFYTHW